MSNSHNSFLLLAICFFFFFFFFSSTTTNVRGHELDNIAELCNRTDHLALCNAIVEQKPGDAVEATIMAIQATIWQIRVAIEKIEKLILESKDGMGKMNLETCKEVYDDAITNLMTSIQNARTMSLPELKISLSAVISDIGTCEDGFMESPDVEFPIAHTNTVLGQLASTSLALATEVKG